jgi:predicted nucleic acid-binding protein
MAASPVLADSSFYIGLMRQGRDPLRELALTAATRDIAVCGVVRCEVGRALRPLERLQRFQRFWSVAITVPTDNRLWDAVESLAWQLDREGTVLPLTDLVIACCAQRIGAVVLTFDKHFGLIPGVRVTNQLEV